MELDGYMHSWTGLDIYMMTMLCCIASQVLPIEQAEFGLNLFLLQLAPGQSHAAVLAQLKQSLPAAGTVPEGSAILEFSDCCRLVESSSDVSAILPDVRTSTKDSSSPR